MKTSTTPCAANQKFTGQPASVADRSRAKKTTPNDATNHSNNKPACRRQRMVAGAVSEAAFDVIELPPIRTKLAGPPLPLARGQLLPGSHDRVRIQRDR